MKLNEQIAFLRKEKSITQEELANALGVSNQAVSKWENGQCCPDIELLPEIAKYFNVSIDELMNHTSGPSAEELILNMRALMSSTADGDDFALGMRIAFALHGALLAKYVSRNKIEKLDAAVFDEFTAGKDADSWGISGIYDPAITSFRRAGSVFYSNNKNLKLDNAYLRHIASVFRTFSDVSNLKTLRAAYCLTYFSEETYVRIEDIAGESGLQKEKVEGIIENELYEYFTEKTVDGKSVWRIKGCYMHLIPLMAMFGERDWF